MDLKKMEEVYRKWENKSGTAPHTTTTCMSGNERLRDKFREDPPLERQRRRARKRSGPPTLDLVPELARFKTTPPVYYEPVASVRRPFMGQCCLNCSSGRRDMIFTPDIPAMGLRNVLQFRRPRSSIIARIFPHLYVAYTEGINYDYPSRGCLAQEVLGSRRVYSAINKAAFSDSEGKTEVKYQSELQRHAVRAGRVLTNMASSISNLFLRITGWFLLKVLGMILFSVQVHQGQLEMLKRASKVGIPLAILPTHRSHLDYILMSFILYIYGIRVPFIAAGDNLNIPVFGWIMRKLGAFFIKRKLDKEVGKKDHVYRALLHTYMEEVLRGNQNIEFFIEGGRSRSGKALAPKGGLLSVIVDAYLDGVISDAFIVPASVSYEKILDGNFNNEQMGRQKKKETFWVAIGGVFTVFASKFGHVRVGFAEPFSLKEYLESAQMPSPVLSDMSSVLGSPRSHPTLKKTASDHSLYGTDVVVEDQRQLVKGLGEHIVHDAVRVHTIMSTNLVAFLLMTKHRQGIEINKFAEEAEWLKGEIIGRGRDIGFSGEMLVVVKHALSVMGSDLVSVEKHNINPDVVNETIEKKDKTETDEDEKMEMMVVPNMALPRVFELSYYSNSVISVFLMESILTNAIMAEAHQELHCLTAARDHRVILSKDKVMQRAAELCDLLQFEFIFVPPCGCLHTSLCDALDRMTISDIIIPEKKVGGGGADSKWAQRVASGWDDTDDEDYGIVVTKEEKITVNSSPEPLKKLLFLQSILGPLIEGYWLTACNLVRLLDRDLPETEFSNLVNEYAKDRVARGLAVFSESCAMDTLRNAWRTYQHWKVIDTYQDAEKVKMIHLKEKYRSEDKLGDFIDKIQVFCT
ncbi:LOW QUALITY PROTEIN: glycerol-3-phosphate acyltransferase 1, mitochondrial-like [Asterias amurensis]|uniref:LOW QUALITY PROTEIN: glycerol-3-phosphate acyltransferase 1, mitochondrial-like n=1 Tax=Asterias amurensis TaxID=7602 RepID=UPI003AB36754